MRFIYAQFAMIRLTIQEKCWRSSTGGYLTLCRDTELVFEINEHLQWEGLSFLPDINEFFDFLLQVW